MSDNVQDAILLTISMIPKGKVSTYGKIAGMSGAPGKARYVGHILKTLPPQSNIPWHRVINSQGKSSFPVNSEKYQEQMSRLADEEITAINGKISLKHFLWTT